jgi:hypothetical protein
MSLANMTMKELLELHNTLAEKKANPKSFSTKAKLIARIESLQAARGAAAAAPEAQADAKPAKAPKATRKKKDKKEAQPRGIGVGALARELIMRPEGYPYALIAKMVNEQLKGATATPQSVRWYAAKMRKDGADVPERAKEFPAEMDEAQTKEWLETVRVVRPAKAKKPAKKK